MVVIDKDRKAFQRLPIDWPGRTILGFGFDRDVLEDARVSEASALAAVTSGDNTNILTARVARETYQIENVVARIYDPRRALIYQRLGISTVATVKWTTDQAMRRLFPDQANSEWTDASGKVQLVELQLPAHLAGKRHCFIDRPGEVKAMAYTRANSARLVTDGSVGQEGDILHIAVSMGYLDDLEALFKGELER